MFGRSRPTHLRGLSESKSRDSMSNPPSRRFPCLMASILLAAMLCECLKSYPVNCQAQDSTEGTKAQGACGADGGSCASVDAPLVSRTMALKNTKLLWPTAIYKAMIDDNGGVGFDLRGLGEQLEKFRRRVIAAARPHLTAPCMHGGLHDTGFILGDGTWEILRGKTQRHRSVAYCLHVTMSH